jgi:hypothetical protein
MQRALLFRPVLRNLAWILII